MASSEQNVGSPKNYLYKVCRRYAMVYDCKKGLLAHAAHPFDLIQFIALLHEGK